jgi:hypothetical protein
MKLQVLVASCLLALGAGAAQAADQSIDLSSGDGSFIGTSPLLDGGNDVISFINLAAGTYNFDFTLSSQHALITSVTVNGQAATQVSFGNFQFFGLSSTDNSPFTVNIVGTANSRSLYSGELQVTAVPEPETYAMMLAGLAAMGFIVRRRSVG